MDRSVCYHVLYNPLSSGSSGTEKVRALEARMADSIVSCEDVTALGDLAAYIQGLPEGDRVILAGGDGTLHHMVNAIAGHTFTHELYYYPIGSGNDFAADIGEKPEGRLIPLERYIQSLPTVEFGGKKRCFVNCAGNGLDGYICAEGARIRETSDKPVNYTAIALKALLGVYRPCAGTVTVDGVAHHYDKIWLAPVMNGRYFGGGMMMAPGQDRMDPKRTLSVVVVHDCGRLRILPVFPSIFKGEHMKHTDLVDLWIGRDITVEYDRPETLEIDGEVEPNVKVCRCVSPALSQK